MLVATILKDKKEPRTLSGLTLVYITYRSRVVFIVVKTVNIRRKKQKTKSLRSAQASYYLKTLLLMSWHHYNAITLLRSLFQPPYNYCRRNNTHYSFLIWYNLKLQIHYLTYNYAGNNSYHTIY